MMLRKGAYYLLAYVEGKQRWTPLGRDYAQALHTYAEVERGEPVPLHTVSGLLSAYVADRTLKRSPKTVTDYRLQSAQLIAVFGDLRLIDVRRSDVARYLALRGNVAGNRERDLFRAAWNWALNTGLTESPNPMAGMRVRNPEGLKKERMEYVTTHTLLRLTRVASPNLRVLLLFLYLTGMRIGDALRLELEAGGERGVAWKMSKTRKLNLVSWSRSLHIVWNAAAGGREVGPLFLSRKKKGYSLGGIEAMFARLRVRAGVRDVSLHSIRGKASDDVPLAHAQELLGHADARVTKHHYRRKVRAVKPTR